MCVQDRSRPADASPSPPKPKITKSAKLEAEAEFRYSDLLPTGADDTPYRLITTEGAAAVEARIEPVS
jgi:hypothetical protein